MQHLCQVCVARVRLGLREKLEDCEDELTQNAVQRSGAYREVVGVDVYRVWRV